MCYIFDFFVLCVFFKQRHNNKIAHNIPTKQEARGPNDDDGGNTTRRPIRHAAQRPGRSGRLAPFPRLGSLTCPSPTQERADILPTPNHCARSGWRMRGDPAGCPESCERATTGDRMSMYGTWGREGAGEDRASSKQHHQQHHQQHHHPPDLEKPPRLRGHTLRGLSGSPRRRPLAAQPVPRKGLPKDTPTPAVGGGGNKYLNI